MRAQTRSRTTNRTARDERDKPSEERRSGMSWIEWSVLFALAVALVLATLAASFILQEQISMARLGGIVVVIAGVFLLAQS